MADAEGMANEEKEDAMTRIERFTIRAIGVAVDVVMFGLEMVYRVKDAGEALLGRGKPCK